MSTRINKLRLFMGGVTPKLVHPLLINWGLAKSWLNISLKHTPKEMILAGLTPNMASCNAALCAAKAAGRWQEAEELLEKLLDSICITGCHRDFKLLSRLVTFQ